MTRHRDQVLGPEERRLLENVPPDFRQRQAIRRRIETVVPACGLHGLERHAADARLRNGVVDDLSDLTIVYASLHRHDQRRRNAVAVEPLERLLADPAEIGAA